MHVTILLCDAAQVADGKLYVLGWGWSFTGPEPSPQAIAMRFDVAGTELGTSHHWELFLEDQDGQPVVLDQPDGTSVPIEVRGDFEVPKSRDIVAGVPVSVPVALHFGPLPIAPGGRYNWRLLVDGETDESWRVSFSTRALPEQEPEGA